ncbi:MAG: sodium:proton antiporter NhaD [Brumimicrobium sp.]
MEVLVVIAFILGYVGITLEHSLKVDKLVPALLMMVLAWVFVSLGMDGFTEWFSSSTSELIDITGLGDPERKALLQESLLHHFGKTAEILIFLLGAMTIVEIVDYFNGFSVIKTFIKTTSKRKLLWIISILAFFLSSIIDNLTATIVLITILRNLLDKREDRMWFAGLIILSANAGGAWSPIGDVTTTMLWMADLVTTLKLMEYLFIPSLINMLIPVIIASFLPPFKGTFELSKDNGEVNPKSKFMLYLGLSMIVFVPIFKTVFELPPYLGMMFSLAVVSIFGEFHSRRQMKVSHGGIITEVPKGDEQVIEHKSPTFLALSKIEMPSILFFLGILMAVAAMESLGLIFNFGTAVQEVMHLDVFVIILGLASAIIDNVPLVAASMGMFDVVANPTDSLVWHFIAYSAGTGGSILIIGSAAGVVAMGMEKISFFWYMKRISLLALIGFFAGAGFYLLERLLTGTM